MDHRGGWGPIPRLISHALGGGAGRAVLVDLEFADGCDRSAIITPGSAQIGRRVHDVFSRLWQRGEIDWFELNNGNILLLVEPGQHDVNVWTAVDMRHLAVNLWDAGFSNLRHSELTDHFTSLLDLKNQPASGGALCERDGDCSGEMHAWLLLRAACASLPLVWHIDLEHQTVVPPTPAIVTRP